jgi:hypothetical protein
MHPFLPCDPDRRDLEAFLEARDDLFVQATTGDLRRVRETRAELLRHAEEKAIYPFPGQEARIVLGK